MAKAIKPILLATGSAVILAGVTIASVTTVTGDHKDSAPPGAAARGQQADFSSPPTNPAPSPTTFTPRPTKVHIRVKNYAAFTGELCIDNEREYDSVFSTENHPMCTGDILPNVTKVKDVDAEPNADPRDHAQVHLYARTVMEKEFDVPLGDSTHCFRFDGTIFKIGPAKAKITQVDCAKL